MVDENIFYYAAISSFVFGILSAAVAEFRDISRRKGFMYGFSLGIFGLVHVCFMKKPEEENSTIQHDDPVMMTCSYGSEIAADSIPCPDSGRMFIQPTPNPAIQEDFVPPTPAQAQRKQPTGSPKAEYAYSLLRIGQKLQALPVLKELVREEPDNEKAWLSLYLCVDRKEQQKYCLQQALRINPGNKKAQQRLGKLYIPADALQNGDNSPDVKNTPLICSQCKMPLSPKSLFCEHCGNPVLEEDTLLDDPLPPARLTAAQYPVGVIQQNAWNPPPVYAQPQIQPEKRPGAGRVLAAFIIMAIVYGVLWFGSERIVFPVIFPYIYSLLPIDYSLSFLFFLPINFVIAFFTPLSIRALNIRRIQAMVILTLVIILFKVYDALQWGGYSLSDFSIFIPIATTILYIIGGMLGVLVFNKSHRKLAAVTPQPAHIPPTVQPSASVPEAEPNKFTIKRILSGIGLLSIIISGVFPWVSEGTLLFGHATERGSTNGFETTEGAIAVGLGLFSLILLFSIEGETPAHLWATFLSLIASWLAYSFSTSQNTGVFFAFIGSTYCQLEIGPYLVFGGAALVLICILIPSRKIV